MLSADFRGAALPKSLDRETGDDPGEESASFFMRNVVAMDTQQRA
jgi:hypothetical protein